MPLPGFGFGSLLGIHAALNRNVHVKPADLAAPPPAVSSEGHPICDTVFLIPNGTESPFAFDHEGNQITVQLHHGTEYERRLELSNFPIHIVSQNADSPIHSMDELVADVLDYFYGRWGGGHGVRQLHLSPLGTHGDAWHSNRFQWQIGTEPKPPTAADVAHDEAGVTKIVHGKKVHGASLTDRDAFHNEFQMTYKVGVRFESTLYFDNGEELANQGFALREKRWYPADAKDKPLDGVEPLKRGLYVKKTMFSDLHPAPKGEHDPMEVERHSTSALHPFHKLEINSLRGLPLFLERDEYHIPIPNDWSDEQVLSAARALIATFHLPNFNPHTISVINRVDTTRYAIDLAWYSDPYKRASSPIKLGFMTLDSYRSHLTGAPPGPEHLQLEVELFPELYEFAQKHHVDFEELFFAIEGRYGAKVTVVPKYLNP